MPAAADAVVVGGGTVGAWCAYFLRQAGLDQVILLEKRTLGQGASSRAAGIVRTQGGTTWAVQLGEWSRRFYLSQHERLGIDSGFTPQGYVLPDLDPSRLPMVFDLSAGLYWRPEEKGLLFGMSNPDERPGPAARVDEEYLARMRERLAELVPVTRGLGLRRVWAATIDYTPDHLPIIGPAVVNDEILNGLTVASAGGAGMMWGPAVARAAADVALTGSSDVVDTAVLGLDRFDADGNSRLAADPIALPFPAHAPPPGTHAPP